jgi:hypothetical protein
MSTSWCLQGPQLVIMVPTRELGVQIVMLIYKLYGGAVNSQVPGDAANMFTYKGPRGLKANCSHSVMPDNYAYPAWCLQPFLAVKLNSAARAGCWHLLLLRHQIHLDITSFSIALNILSLARP